MKKQFGLMLMGSVAFLSCTTTSPQQQLAETILNDTTLHQVDSMARSIISQGFNAGSGYSQIWARDMNTFIEVACEETNQTDIRNAILLFFALQQPNDEMIDGYVLKPDFTWYDNHPYYADAAPDHVGFKNTVETDQESSLIQIVGKYIRKTGDTSILREDVAGRTVLERMDDMVDYLMRERYSEQYGLLFGAMTADWGDVQPNDDFGCDMNELSSRAIDVYDNAMFLIALDYLQEMTDDASLLKKWKGIREQIAQNVRKYLWDAERKKFIPHLYIDPSPIPAGFDENQIHYHGGTAVAALAGMLTEDEIAHANDRMLENMRKAHAQTIGLTMYPTYPAGYFKSPGMYPYGYQNGGDWTWFGARMIWALAENGYIKEAYEELKPMLARVIENNGFNEWYTPAGEPMGSGTFRGEAGVLVTAIAMLRDWAEDKR